MLLHERDLYVVEHHFSAAFVGQIDDRCEALGARRATSPRREGDLYRRGFPDEDVGRVGRLGRLWASGIPDNQAST